MKRTLALLAVTTAVTATVGLPALAAIRGAGCASDACVLRLDDADQTLPLIRVSGHDDDDDGGFWRKLSRRWHDDDDDDDDEGCDDDDDDGGCIGGRANAAPAGTVAPPANGLFGNGAAPRAVTN